MLPGSSSFSAFVAGTWHRRDFGRQYERRWHLHCNAKRALEVINEASQRPAVKL